MGMRRIFLGSAIMAGCFLNWMTSAVADSSVFGIDLVELGFDDSNSNSIGDIAIDSTQLVCDEESNDLEPFYSTQLIAKVANSTDSNFLVRFSRIKVRDPNNRKVIWRSRNLPGSFTNVRSGDTGEFITVIATPKGLDKVFINSEVALKDYHVGLNVEVTLLIRTPFGSLRRRGTILMVPTPIDNC